MSITLDQIDNAIANSPNGCVETNELSFKEEQIIIPERMYNFIHYRASEEFFVASKDVIKMLLPRAILPKKHKESITVMLDEINIDKCLQALYLSEHRVDPVHADEKNQLLGRLISILEILVNSTQMNLFRVEKVEDVYYSKTFERVCSYIRCKVRWLTGNRAKHSKAACQKIDYNYRKGIYRKPDLED